MFSSNPLDKSCIGPDCSSGRNNASNRFPVGITSLGDENQQIRIQLAVHKYNSSAGSPLNSRCGVISPYRHSFLNNSLKAKSYDGETEGTAKSEKRNGNQYEGVGAFPTIHLRKSAVRYRPIRRFNDVKVSYPELPVNRFLSNLPEVCSDVKSSTRSVLDVLEDLSGKKIHSKDENGSSKLKSKGLGGDYLLNQNAVYKPLFVQKPKISSVLTRDNTTQTLSAVGSEAPSPQSSNSFIRNDSSDPRAELRRKLAKQNNEIFASLSSSISSSFSLKRKIDKVAPGGHDDSPTDGSAKKNPRMDQTNNFNGNGVSKSVSRSKAHGGDPVKLTRKTQLKESNSPTSPNKDRLTTIFLDMQNTSPKAQIFQNNSTLPEAKTTEASPQPQAHLSNGFTHISNGFSNSVSSTPVKGSSGAGGVEDGKDKSSLNNSSNLDFAEKTATDLKKPEIDGINTFNFPLKPVSPVLNNVTKPTFQFGINTSASDLGATKSPTENKSSSEDSTKRSENEVNTEKKPEGNGVPSKPFTFGSSSEKPNFSAFKFGTDSNASVLNVSAKDPKTSEAAPLSTTSVPSPTPQFSFGTTATSTGSAPQSFPVQFGVAGAQDSLASPPKPSFTFGQIVSPSQQSPASTKLEEKAPVPNSSSTSVTTTTQSVQPHAFRFGEKSVTDSAVKTAAGQAVPSQVGLCQSTTISFTSGAGNASTNPPAAVQNSKPLFSFGQKPETPTTSTTSGTTAPEQPKFTFTFGQKSDGEQNKAQELPKSTNLFSFGQKSVAQESPSTGALTSVVSPSQPSTTQTTSVFGQNVPQVTSSPQMKFGQIPSPQTTSSFGAKSEVGTLGSMTTPTFSQGNSSFPMKTSLFGPSPSSTTTQTTTGLGTSTSNAPGFNFGAPATTQSTPTFGVSSASQAAPSFGAPTTQTVAGFGGSSTTQATSTFGTSLSNPAFGVSATTQSTSAFPVPSTTQSGTSFGGTSTTQSLPAFRTPSISQSTPSFGISTTTQSISTFGVSSVSQSTPGFGASSTTQSTQAFAPSSGFGAPTSSHQPSTAFGAPTPSQSAVRFGAPMPQANTSFGVSTGFTSTTSTQASITFGSPSATSTAGFGASQSSFSQPFNNKPTTSLRPTTSIFGQTPAPSFPSGNTFNTNQNNVFGQKPNSEGEMFDQNKIQTPAFGSTSQAFGSQNKFGFGMSTSNATGFTTSPPNTTSPPVFSFGSSSTANTFTFGGSGASMPGNTQTPFAFKSPTSEPFKFGANTTKEGPGFGGNPATFSFGGQMNNNNAITEQKPAFSFGSAQAPSSAPFAFGTTPSPSVFSFGGSTSGSSGSSFNFGTPTPGGPFGQTPSASPGVPFPVPGTFSIGSGSSQSRPRATSRPRRRP